MLSARCSLGQSEFPLDGGPQQRFKSTLEPCVNLHSVTFCLPLPRGETVFRPFGWVFSRVGGQSMASGVGEVNKLFGNQLV